MHFLFQKAAERAQVMAKYGDENVYQVEPNVKEGPGGLRDAQIVEWFAEVLFRIDRSEALARLVEARMIRDVEAAQYTVANAFLFAARNALHSQSGEGRDVLTTEKQEVVAGRLGYRDSPERPAVEIFMADYFEHAALIRKLDAKVTIHCLDSFAESAGRRARFGQPQHYHCRCRGSVERSGYAAACV